MTRAPGRVFADWSPLRQDAGFRTQWLGQLGSAIGRETAKYAFPIHIYLLTGSLALVGVVAAFQLLATVVLSLGGGALSDLFDRRLILVIALVVMALGSIGMLALSLVDRPPIELMVLLGVIVTTTFTMEQPARLSAVPRLVPPERLTSAIALTSLNFQALSVAGPALAALLYAIAGLPAAYALQAAGYLWAVVNSARMPALPPPPTTGPPRSPFRMLADSFAFVRQRRLVLSTFAIDLNAMIFALPAGSLLPVLLIAAFSATPEQVGLLISARGAGAVAAAIFSGWTRSLLSFGRALLSIVLVYSAATVALGFATFSFLLAVPIVALCGAMDVSSAILRNAIIQTATPDELRGRVTAIHVLSAGGGPRVGDMRAAAMAEAIGAQGALIVGGLIAMAGVAAVARGFPELRTYRLARAGDHRAAQERMSAATSPNSASTGQEGGS